MWETTLPGLSQWGRVADYRLGQLRKLPNVSLYPESDLTPADALEFGAAHLIIATGARWTAALCGANELPTEALQAPRVFTPDDIAAGTKIEGPIAVFDFDNYYMGSAVAEHLAATGAEVTYITTAGAASAWSFMTNEQPGIHQALARRGISLRTLENRDRFRCSTHACADFQQRAARDRRSLAGDRWPKIRRISALRRAGQIQPCGIPAPDGRRKGTGGHRPCGVSRP